MPLRCYCGSIEYIANEGFGGGELLEQYFKKLLETTKTGDATEPSYYQSLVELLEEFAASVGKKHIQVTTLPKKTEAGNPDFRVWDGRQSIVGYIEAKPPTVENLDFIETTDQLKRYRNTFPNLILTNFFEFRRYRNGQLTDKVSIGRPFVLHQLKTIPPIENQDKLLKTSGAVFRLLVTQNILCKVSSRGAGKEDKVLEGAGGYRGTA